MIAVNEIPEPAPSDHSAVGGREKGGRRLRHQQQAFQSRDGVRAGTPGAGADAANGGEFAKIG